MEQAEPVGVLQSEDRLLCTLTEAIREIEAVSLLQSPCGRGADGGRPCGEEVHEEQDGGAAAASGTERRCLQKVLVVLKELSISHTVRVAAWRDALRQCVQMLANQPLGGSKHQHQLTDGTEAFLGATTDSLFLKLLNFGFKVIGFFCFFFGFLKFSFNCISDLFQE